MKRLGRGDGSLVLRGRIWYLRYYAAGREHRVTTGTADRGKALQLLLQKPWKSRRRARPPVALACGGNCDPIECVPCRLAARAETKRVLRAHRDLTRYATNPELAERRRRSTRRRSGRRHGVTLDQVKAAQGRDGCWICGAEAAMIDHDHRHCPKQYGCPKCVRGALCRRCNVLLGLVRDDPAVLVAAVSYLERYRPGTEAGSPRSAALLGVS